MPKFLVTGGAGFLGSHLIDRLIARGDEVICIDKLVLGTLKHIAHHVGRPEFQFIQGDVLDPEVLSRALVSEDIQGVFHLAGRSVGDKGSAPPDAYLRDTFQTTTSLLNALRQRSPIKLLFASSAAVYGEQSGRTSEMEVAVRPISMYGAAKLASEAFIAAFSASYGISSVVLRLTNIIGPRMTHGIICDFLEHLRDTPTRLHILGDGTQERPFLYVSDAIDAILLTYERSSLPIQTYNLGGEDLVTVTRVAEIVKEELGLPDLSFDYAGGARGWRSDIPRVSCDLSRVSRLGWRANFSSESAIRRAVREQLEWYGVAI